MTRVAYAVSLGLVVAAAPLGLSVADYLSSAAALQANSRSEDDRGSGRLSRRPYVTNYLSFRGSGRVDPTPPAPDWHSPVAYRGSGRITNPRAI